MTDFKKLNLNETILRSLEKKGYITPTPIQAQAIPHLLTGRDLLGIAQTGTGKTAAFSLPIIDNLSKNKKPVKPNHARALILTPTRELASQIADSIKIYGHNMHLKHTIVFGGVSENSQIREMGKGVDILIATPGRLLDLINQGYIKLSDLEIFVLDEADRMLDMGFINDVKKIITYLPEERQTLFFSATMPQDIVSLAKLILKDPVTIEVTPASTTVEKIDQKINFVDKANKKLLLKNIIIQQDVKSVLVFSRTKHGANKVVEYLASESITVAAIHGNKSQPAREKALSNFRSGKVKVLVATDIAARGIDVPGVTHVINFDIPNDPESYVHRIGRTARAGKEGIAISFCDPSERKLLAAVEKLIKINIPVDRDHPFQNSISKEPKKSSDSISLEKPERSFKKQRDRSDYSRSNEDRRRGRFSNYSNQEERGERRKFNRDNFNKEEKIKSNRDNYFNRGERKISNIDNQNYFDREERRERKSPGGNNFKSDERGEKRRFGKTKSRGEGSRFNRSENRNDYFKKDEAEKKGFKVFNFFKKLKPGSSKSRPKNKRPNY